jgi:hypothetical protein
LGYWRGHRRAANRQSGILRDRALVDA